MLSWLSSCIAITPQSAVAPEKAPPALTMAEPYPEVQRPSTLYMMNRQSSLVRNSVIPPPPSHNRVSKRPLHLMPSA
ncbi:hypothetical protein INT44_007843 [Umbelopsis vinacea]|uniref:Uncharacterized protein n=1 Tax=Umbelopsis vinacea TaxID=44442 RepID=A0A8H7UA55_9FUNG|nr:hypothetical protein INT44_007843 [Umbelopsis vinacea]